MSAWPLGGDAGQRADPVANPYSVAAPAPWLAGRRDIVAPIASLGSAPGPRAPVVLYGSRRMGKTRIARAMPTVCRLEDDSWVVFLNLQIVDWTYGLGDLGYATAFTLWEAEPGRGDKPAPASLEQRPTATLRHWLTRLGPGSPPRRYIRLLDEYELPDQPGAEFAAAVDALARRDVAACQRGAGRYRVERRRRWAALNPTPAGE